MSHIVYPQFLLLLPDPSEMTKGYKPVYGV